MSFCYVFRVALVGSSGTGKTTLAFLISETTTANPKTIPPRRVGSIDAHPSKRSVWHQPLPIPNVGTTGVELYPVSLVVKTPTSVLNRIQMYDTPGGGDNEGLARGLITGATLPSPVDGCLVLCDGQVPASIEEARRWIDFIATVPHPIEVVVGFVNNTQTPPPTLFPGCNVCAVNPTNLTSSLAALEMVVAPIHIRTEKQRLAAAAMQSTNLKRRPSQATKTTPPCWVPYEIREMEDASSDPTYWITLCIIGSTKSGKSTFLSAVSDNCVFLEDYIPSTKSEVATFDVVIKDQTQAASSYYTVRTQLWEVLDAKLMPSITAGVFLLIDLCDTDSFTYAKNYVANLEQKGGIAHACPHYILIRNALEEDSPLMSTCHAWAARLHGSVVEMDMADVRQSMARRTLAALLHRIVSATHVSQTKVQERQCVVRDDNSSGYHYGTLGNEQCRRALFESIDVNQTGYISSCEAAKVYNQMDPFQENKGQGVVDNIMAKFGYKGRSHDVNYDMFSAVLCRLTSM